MKFNFRYLNVSHLLRWVGNGIRAIPELAVLMKQKNGYSVKSGVLKRICNGAAPFQIYASEPVKPS